MIQSGVGDLSLVAPSFRCAALPPTSAQLLALLHSGIPPPMAIAFSTINDRKARRRSNQIWEGRVRQRDSRWAIDHGSLEGRAGDGRVSALHLRVPVRAHHASRFKMAE
ncbi:unnamed protein product [Linum trigynum]|uniref:Uncharacterized protein n=1 Tax=Linum trigynum TaxID=586398 RepID=A0AAV2EWP6_9ROSI